MTKGEIEASKRNTTGQDVVDSIFRGKHSIVSVRVWGLDGSHGEVSLNEAEVGFERMSYYLEGKRVRTRRHFSSTEQGWKD